MSVILFARTQNLVQMHSPRINLDASYIESEDQARGSRDQDKRGGQHWHARGTPIITCSSPEYNKLSASGVAAINVSTTDKVVQCASAMCRFRET